MAVRPYRFHLRPTLLVTIMVLVLLTALAVALSASLLLVSVTDTLLHRSRQVSLNATEAGIRDYLNDAPQFTSEFASLAKRGLLSFEDHEHLAAVFAEQLRVSPLLHEDSMGSG